MIVIHVRIQVKPESRNEFMQQAQEDMEIGKVQQGCLHYQWMEDVNNSNTFTIYEEWDMLADFELYKQSDHFAQLNTIFEPLMAAPPTSSYYTVEPVLVS